ncbi:MAG: hypothetical protein JSR85_04705 [Proteobacteria bacterium]|nr:hypothetical protein [Pseudomonadota bacterium]
MKNFLMLCAIGAVSLTLSGCAYYGGVDEPYYGPGYDGGFYGYDYFYGGGHGHHGGHHH